MDWSALRPRTVKDYLVQFLSQKWPSNPKQLHQLMRKSTDVSYQAVHKALNELVDEKVLVRKDNLYQLNPNFVKHIHKHWEAIENKLYSGQADNVGIILGEKVVTPTAAYVFGEREMVVSHIPSVFISHSTLQEFVHFSSKSTLDRIAKFIAIKDIKHIEAHMASPKELKENPLVALDKLNELAVEFYWGKVGYTKSGNLIQIKIESNVFTSPKARFFYEKLYDYFMQDLGYKKVGQNPLEKTLTYAPKKKVRK